MIAKRLCIALAALVVCGAAKAQEEGACGSELENLFITMDSASEDQVIGHWQIALSTETGRTGRVRGWRFLYRDGDLESVEEIFDDAAGVPADMSAQLFTTELGPMQPEGEGYYVEKLLVSMTQGSAVFTQTASHYYWVEGTVALSISFDEYIEGTTEYDTLLTPDGQSIRVVRAAGASGLSGEAGEATP